MSISLSKGGNINLSKEDPSLNNVLIGLGWDARSTDGAPFDLDASLFMVKADGKVPSDAYFIFYNQMRSPEGSVEHTGDNRTGAGEGDDEQILVTLSKVPPEIQRLVIAVTIYDAEARRQNFGQVSNAFVRLVNRDNNQEVVRFDLSEDYSTETAMIFGEIYRHGGDWKFRAVGQGYSGGLRALALAHGVNVG
ncbi:TerD family protein [Caldichromatium japonicum]|uniref:TerD family protein n=1 Tax=Caldichromatium japonicum TaxID=2699430 RepID=A0A6G7VFP7_9GAMM|nr:TerD family protein [Caldichromatium japonicum]QIK38730.1 TerD family protein [Caldichromatium japonicum]